MLSSWASLMVIELVLLPVLGLLSGWSLEVWGLEGAVEFADFLLCTRVGFGELGMIWRRERRVEGRRRVPLWSRFLVGVRLLGEGIVFGPFLDGSRPRLV